ncbi:hypothetical protein [Methylophilus sp. Leaf414]|uniref:hypothetical protein n=1 Tax=Methylophilus sp. Leaf414 TaxID=1736371 RepID=UPI00070233A3|nr:hypothetical protein [Methylophilus sp. Leaf414]KQT34187.1 hypothetical protein ASG24_10600 [Methylophilus sp. Leaf414]
MASEINHLQTTKRLNLLSLFTSGSTLICCALPATLVAIGSVATLTSLVSQFPQLIWISEHKALVFGLAAVMLLLAGWLQWRARSLPCPTDPQLAMLCMKTRRQSLWVYWISVTLFLIGSFFAFVAPLLIE